MKKHIPSIILCLSICGFNSQAAEINTSGENLLENSGLTMQDFESTGWLYKMESEKHGHNQYALEYKFALAAAQLGSKEAPLWIGEMYQGGHVPNINETEAVQYAFQWWEKAVKAGQPRGYTDMALVYMHQEVPGGGKKFGPIELNYPKAIELLNKANDAGDMKAPRILGLLYLNGNDAIPKDEAKAISYFKKAADNGDSTGTVYYADALLTGKHLKKDIHQSMSLYQSVIDKEGHDAGACGSRLGKIYEEGKHVPKDLKKAIHYYEIAAKHGDKDAEAKLKSLLNS